MRKSFVALALLVGAAALLTNLALAQDVQTKAPRMLGHTLDVQKSRVARLGTTAGSDTAWVGHATTAGGGVAPNFVHTGPYRPGVSHDGVWDFDEYNGGACDSLQGWVPYVWTTNDGQNFASNNDNLRPWVSVDIGNRINLPPIQGRAYGVVGVWHQDGGGAVGDPNFSPGWSPLGGSMSAWCGLRCDGDFSYVDDPTYGGTGMPYTGDALTWQ